MNALLLRMARGTLSIRLSPSVGDKRMNLRFTGTLTADCATINAPSTPSDGYVHVRHGCLH
jgi:hypothetical protein